MIVNGTRVPLVAIAIFSKFPEYSCVSTMVADQITTKRNSYSFFFLFQMFAFVSLIVIILSVATFCLESIPALEKKYKTLFVGIEYFYLVWFTADFLARLCTCPSIRGFLKNFMTWVDITSVIPLYINVSSSSVSDDLTFLFVLRLIRIFRLFRFFRTMSGMQVIGHTLKASARELFLLVLMLLIPMVIFSTLVFYAEKVRLPNFLHSDFKEKKSREGRKGEGYQLVIIRD